MGVKDLWTILSPVCERKSLWDLQGKTIAIDLSCWICENQNVGENKAQPRMYLRNLFFRANCLVLLGAIPIFVLEGKAPELKYDTIEKRQNTRRKGALSQSDASNRGNRSRLNGLLNKCKELLSIMGLPYVQSPGEAESFCALLNNLNIVDGCITQDSDCFLYGAQTVYRNFTINTSGGGSGNNAGFSIDVYNMSVIENRLSLKRNDLIAICLLCGSDYNGKGVSGIGKETVLKLLQGIRNEDMLDRMKRWRTDKYFEELEEKRMMVAQGLLCEVCGHSGKKVKHAKSGCNICGELTSCKKNIDFPISDPNVTMELIVRKKALQDPEFPSQMLIDEYLLKNLNTNNIAVNKSWNKPDLKLFLLFSKKLLGWTETYAIEKFLPLVTRWQTLQLQADKKTTFVPTFQFLPLKIVKKRVIRGVDSYEIIWQDTDGMVMEIDSNISVVTVEPQSLIANAYPEIVKAYEDTRIGKSKKVPKKRGANCLLKGNKEISLKGKENDMINFNEKQTRIDRFLKSPAIAQKKQCVLHDRTNKLFAEYNLSKTDSESLKMLQPKSNSVKELGDYFLEMSLEAKDLDVQTVSTPSHIHQISKHTNQTENKISNYEESFESSHSWSTCEMCDDDDINDQDLSLIVDSIVNKNVPKEENIHILKESANVENVSGQVHVNDGDSSDEFDNLEDNYIPFIDLIKSQL